MGALVDAAEEFRSGRQAKAAPARRRTPALVVLARLAARTLPRWAQVRTTVLSLAGFGLLTAGAFTFALWAGLIAAGVSCLVLEALAGSER